LRKGIFTVNLIELNRVGKAYTLGGETIHALRDLTLHIPRGEFVVIEGPSGSGKTTLLNLIGGLERLDSGQLTVDGQTVAALDEHALTAYRRRKIGLVFQFFNLIPTLTALENVRFAAELVPDQAADPAEMLAMVGLGDRLHHYPGQLSGGQQQRVAIARALVKNPALVLADEPTGSLDTRTGQDVLVVMRRINRERGQTFVIVTHNTAIAQMADRVIRLSSGQVAEMHQIADPRATQELEW
jgi:putative ABC transport system ATP-binding protein